ncbi:DUF5719 family protein [Cellulosimicrobium marinum]|uniref:DUF5719 family protein n=1 Tax=Cellulosimicrobium marinum TaxID=1638992 RepID=UPI001E62C6D8|nr:DUF5719 family protein [Cellulosimicrobium marinum]MCB7137173.1 DUF5719 family protein [Cellulosimicrobium marinum]
MTTNPARRLLRRVVTTGAGVLGIGAVGAVVALGGPAADRLPAVDVADPVQQVTVAPAQDVLVCPGPARLTDPEAGGDAQFAPSPVGTQSVARAAVGGDAVSTWGPLGADPQPLDAAPGTDGLALLTAPDPEAGSVLSVQPGDGDPPRPAASVGSVTTDGDLRGLAAASCARPGISHWLVGGSTEIGSSSRLVLQNPGRTPATVQVSVWGQGGEAVLAGGGQQLVGPGEEVVTLVEAAAPEQRRTVVHVQSTGGLVAAWLQHSALDGLVPVGVDHVVPGAAPATALALPGVVSTGEPVDDAHAPRLRLLAPGAEHGAAHVTVLGEDGAVPLRGVEDVALTAGVVTDVSLGGLPPGRYTVVVHADVPVVAGASLDRRGEPEPDLLDEQRRYDRAWVAAQPLDASVPSSPYRAGQVALVPGTTSSLSLAAVPAAAAADGARPDDGGPDDEGPGDAQQGDVVLDVRTWSEDGEPLGERSVTVTGGTTVALDPADLTSEGSDGTPAVVAVDVARADDGLVPAWSVLAAAGGPSGDAGDDEPSLVSVLQPVADGASSREIGVRVTDTAGLGS